MDKNRLRLLYSIVKRYKYQEFIGLFVTILYAIVVFLSPYASQYLIDDVLIANKYEKIYVGIFIFFIICILQPIISYVKNYIFLRISEKIAKDIRKDVFNNIIKTKLEFFFKKKNGELVYKIINDGRQVSDCITDIFVILIKNVLMIIIIIIGMLIQSKKITIIILLFLIANIILNIYFSKKFQVVSKASCEDYDDYSSFIEQSISNIQLIKSFSLEDMIIEKYNNNLKKIYKNNMKTGTYTNILSSLSDIIIISCLCIIYGLGAILVMEGELTLGSVIALGLYFQLLNQPIIELTNSNISINKVLPMVDRLNEFYNLEIEDLNVSKINKNESVSIEFKDVSFKYPDENNNEIYVLKDVFISIDKLGLYYFIGKSGSGKSTISKLLMALYTPNKGKIIIKLGKYELNNIGELRNIISYVSQDTELLNSSIYENLRLNNNDITHKEIEEICCKLGIHSKIMSLENGYNTIISEKINLSGGEKQRLAIARAYLKKSNIYIFDEITSALDVGIEKEVIDIINELSKKSIVIFITHKLDLIKESDNIYIVDCGKVKKGSKKEIKI